jgi:copper chaperone CopZ
MEEKTVFVPAINCGHCVAAIKRELIKLTGVQSVEGEAQTKRVIVRWKEPASWPAIQDKLAQMGYPPQE